MIRLQAVRAPKQPRCDETAGAASARPAFNLAGVNETTSEGEKKDSAHHEPRGAARRGNLSAGCRTL